TQHSSLDNMQAKMNVQRGVRLTVRHQPNFTRVAAFGSSAVSTAQERTANPLPLVFIAAEVAPWSKTGGLGDVVGGLPIELAKRGHKVITIAPRYDQYEDAWDTSVVIKVDGQDVRFFHSIKKGVHRVFVDHPWFLAKASPARQPPSYHGSLCQHRPEKGIKGMEGTKGTTSTKGQPWLKHAVCCWTQQVWGKTGAKLYGPASGADYVDNHKRFALFCKAAIESMKALPFGTGDDAIFVANDWHSALVPVLLKDVYQPRGQFTKAKSALCIHNIAFQGRMWADTFDDLGLPASSRAKLDFQDGNPKVYTEKDPLDETTALPPRGGVFKKVNWLKGGILSADKVLTVSPNYAREISQDPSGGVELDAFLRQKGVEGIVNGMDVEEWDPRVDKYLTMMYDKNTVHAGKAAAKQALQAEAGLPVDASAPLFSFIGRLEEQKGVDILMAAVPKILAKAPNAQILILGTGKAKFEKQVAAMTAAFPSKAKGVVKFSAPLAHLITAGADFILVPSRFEPCGLIQLHAMQYGTVPIVASTGGLVDTVKEGVTGFHMGALDKDVLDPADVDALASTCARAAQAFSTPLYRQMVYNCISQDLSWAKAAVKWEGILETLYLGLASGKAKSDSVAIPVMERIPYPVAATDKPLSSPQPTARTPAMSSGSSPAAAAGSAPQAPSNYVPRAVPVAAPQAAPRVPAAAPGGTPAAAPPFRVPVTVAPAAAPAPASSPATAPAAATPSVKYPSFSTASKK
ncbi:hypothetical protein QJQ45_014218, partial [Haematococcus lacustris]